LLSSFLDLKRQAAPGIDGVTWQDYAKDLETRIADLHAQSELLSMARCSVCAAAIAPSNATPVDWC